MGPSQALDRSRKKAFPVIFHVERYAWHTATACPGAGQEREL